MSIANQIISGEICSICNVTRFDPPTGYPCACTDCYSSLSDEEKKSHQPAPEYTEEK